MRYVLAALTFAAALHFNVSAQAEKRIFIIASYADGYGIDRCLATGAPCGAAAAAAYCRSRDFSQAASYGRVDRDDLTGVGARKRHPGLQRRRLRRIRRHRVRALTPYHRP